MKRTYVFFTIAIVLAASSASSYADWPAGGLHIDGLCSNIGMTTDGVGGLFMSCGGSLQRVSSSGDLLLGPTGVYVGDFGIVGPCLSDGQGGVFFAGMLGNTIIVKRVGPTGNVLWSATACQTTFTKTNFSASLDGAGGVVMVWSENRNLPDPLEALSVYGQHVDVNGNVLWGSDAKRIISGTWIVPHSGLQKGKAEYAYAVMPGSAGGAMVFWIDDDPLSDWSLNVGSWSANGSFATSAHTQVNPYTAPVAASDGAGGSYLVFTMYGSNDRGLKHFAPDATATWTVTMSGPGDNSKAILSPASGAVLAVWPDGVAGSEDVYAQKFDAATGTALWGASPLPVCTATGVQTLPVIVTDHGGGAVIAWNDGRNGLLDIYAQHVDGNGQPYWPVDGLPVNTTSTGNVYPHVFSDPSGYAVVEWLSESGNLAQRLSLAPVAVAISSFDASARNGAVELSAEFRSNVVVQAVNVYRGARDEAIRRIATVAGAARNLRYIDDRVSAGTTYRYRIGVIDDDGEFLSQIVTVTTPSIETSLEQNSPNPFNPETSIRFVLAQPSRATVEVFAADGRRVRSLYDRDTSAGRHAVTWDGTGDNGKPVSSGVYLYRLTAGKFSQSRKMLLIK